LEILLLLDLLEFHKKLFLLHLLHHLHLLLHLLVVLVQVLLNFLEKGLLGENYLFQQFQILVLQILLRLIHQVKLYKQRQVDLHYILHLFLHLLM